MSFFKKEYPDELEEKLETMRLNNQIAEERLELSEKNSMEKELKKKYGRDWKHILNIKDSDAMRQFANAGKTISKVSKDSNNGESRYYFSKKSK